MIDNNECPRCQQEISPERLRQTPAVCDSCGFIATGSETHVRASMESSVLRSAFFLGLLLLGLFMHIGTWANYSLEVIPLEIGLWTKSATQTQLERLSQIGMDLKKYDLVESAYLRQAEMGQYASYVRLGKLQMSRGEFKTAAQTYGKYFALGLVDVEARYDYARVLGEIGLVDDSAKNFEYVLGANPTVRQVTVIQKYVNMLVKAQRFDQAQRVIEHVRRQDPTAARFMDTEYKVIAARMGGNS